MRKKARNKNILFTLQNIRKKGKEIVNFCIIIRCGKQGQSVEINMEKVKDIRSYLKDRKETDAPKLVQTASADAVTRAEITFVENEIQKATQPRKHYNKNIPEKIRKEVGQYANIHGTQAAIKHFEKTYPCYIFKRTSVNNWKNKLKTSKDKNTIFKKKGSWGSSTKNF